MPMGRFRFRPADVLGLSLGQQVEESLAIFVVKLPMVVPTQCEQRGINGGHGSLSKGLIILEKEKDSRRIQDHLRYEGLSSGALVAVMGVGQYRFWAR